MSEGSDRLKMVGKRAARARPVPVVREGPLTVFVHIPRAAGTTFTAVLRDNFPDEVRTIGNAYRSTGGFDPRPIRRLDDAAVLTRDMRVLTGHLPFGALHRLPSDTRFVTFIRDPVDRVLSQYYELLRLGRRRPLPGDGSLEATLAARDVIYDNLQTRMLSDQLDPSAKVDDRLLEQAKQNLGSRFTGFGIVERFDESLILLARQLGLDSLLYVRQRFATRPRGDEVPADMLSAAEGFNEYDVKLYRWAADLFEQRVVEQAPEFHVELAALRAARGGESIERPSVVNPDELWSLLVRERAGALRERLDRASADATGSKEVRTLLEHVHAHVDELSSRLGVAPPAGAAAAPDSRAVQRPLRGTRAALTANRVAAIEEAHADAQRELEQIKSRARSVDESRGGDAWLEAERLRGEAAQAERRVEEIEQRVVRARTKLGNASAGEVAEPVVIPVAAPRAPVEPVAPETFEQRSTFFDAAENYTEFVCTDAGSARFFVRTRDKHIGRALFLKQGRGDMKLLLRCVTTVNALLGKDAIGGRLLIDVGANIGSTSIFALDSGLFSRVVAIEPDPENFETLRLNILLNRLEDRATAIQAAASDAEGEVSLVVNPTRSGKHWVTTDDEPTTAAEDESSITVPAVTLDVLAARGVYDPADVGLLWMDAEHHEGHILSGATELTSRAVPAVFEWDPAGLEAHGGVQRISDALAGRYTHFLDMRASYAPGEPKYQLRAIDELAGHVHPHRTEEGEHFTEILALRLDSGQVPKGDLLNVLRRGRRKRNRSGANGSEASDDDGDSW